MFNSCDPPYHNTDNVFCSIAHEWILVFCTQRRCSGLDSEVLTLASLQTPTATWIRRRRPPTTEGGGRGRSSTSSPDTTSRTRSRPSWNWTMWVARFLIGCRLCRTCVRVLGGTHFYVIGLGHIQTFIYCFHTAIPRNFSVWKIRFGRITSTIFAPHLLFTRTKTNVSTTVKKVITATVTVICMCYVSFCGYKDL